MVHLKKLIFYCVNISNYDRVNFRGWCNKLVYVPTLVYNLPTFAENVPTLVLKFLFTSFSLQSLVVHNLFFYIYILRCWFIKSRAWQGADLLKGNFILTVLKRILYLLYLGTIEQLQLVNNLNHRIRMNISNLNRHILNKSIQIEPGW